MILRESGSRLRVIAVGCRNVTSLALLMQECWRLPLTRSDPLGQTASSGRSTSEPQNWTITQEGRSLRISA